ncbi:MAG: DUF934 domain-containing protein [Alphaproteobacteria bacterium]|nr:DUF934 domain-containing protein [Alphaproteobacteria bacterium]
MPLLKNDAFVNDAWVSLADDAEVPENGSIIVSLARLERDWDQLVSFTGLLGVRLTNTDKVEALESYISQITLVVLPFPAFADGRSYSIARGLRLDGYRGELRAEGNVLPDQLQYMRQVGFDSFAVSDRFPLQVWQSAGKQMSLAYQRGLFRAANEAEVWSARHRGFEPWEEQPHAG